MASRTSLNTDTIDRVLTNALALARTVDHILETRAVAAVVEQPLSDSKVQLLRRLAQHGAQTSSRIAQALRVSKPAVSQIVDSMVRARLVTRKTAKKDRRKVNLQLTTKGGALYRAIRREQRRYLRTALRHADKLDAERWAETMQQITEALDRAGRDLERFCLQCAAYADGTCALVGGDAQCEFLSYRSKTSRGPQRRPARA